MITIKGQKMGTSLGNFITLDQFFSGDHPLLERAYSPMTIRFFILQAHYRGTLDFSNEALQASEKGLERLLAAVESLDKIKPADRSSVEVRQLKDNCYKALNDDFNSPVLIANLFDAVKIINALVSGKESVRQAELEELKTWFRLFVFDILGLQHDHQGKVSGREVVNNLVDMILGVRILAKTNKDWATSDRIRDELVKLGFEIRDTKDGFDWEYKGNL
jgi:cysteinyl-tRNA synthetase